LAAFLHGNQVDRAREEATALKRPADAQRVFLKILDGMRHNLPRDLSD
jgi:hypothetical protein